VKRFALALIGMLLFWLVLHQSVSPGQVLIGLAVAAAGTLMLRTLAFPAGEVRRLDAALRLLGRVVVDVVRSNLAVARIVIGQPALKSGFVDIPLELRSAYGLATLACIITATPGTLWVAFDEDRHKLRIHVLDLIDEAEWISTIKGRYERLLLEIFP
jgi:multicomponent K+:H+ antiporter subunit E